MSRKHDDRRCRTEARLWELFDRIVAEGRATGPTAFAKEAGIDRTYLYTFPELAPEVAAYGKKTQPKVSRRGAGVTKTEAIKRGIDERVRREHTQWSKEISELRQELKDAKDTISKKDEHILDLKKSKEHLMRAYELLLLLASEAGASPVELEQIREVVNSENVGRADVLTLTRLKNYPG